MKKGFLGFLTGTLIGGLTAMLTSKHSGKEVRSKLKTSWDEGKSGGKVVLDEVKDVAEELRRGIEEFSNSPKGKKVKEQVTQSISTVKEKVQEFIEDAKEEVANVKKQVEKSTAKKTPAPRKRASSKASVNTTATQKKAPAKTATTTVKKAPSRAKRPTRAKTVPVKTI